MTHGDINASEIYQDREMLNRLGYGIFDVNWGQNGVGFENVRDFSYVVAQDEDPKLYRRKVFTLTGHYFPNNLAKVLWDKFIDHKWVLSERAGHEIDLKTAAEDWLKNYSHAFLKDWTFNQQEIPERIRSSAEGQGMLDVVTGLLLPNLRELLNSGFSVTDVARAAIAEAIKPGFWARAARRKTRRHLSLRPKLRIHFRPKQAEKGDVTDANWQDDLKYFRVKKLLPEEIREGRFYVRLLANLTGHEPKSAEEAERRWREILEHKWYLSERAGHDTGIRSAALDYFRRLDLLRETESGGQAPNTAK
ncbi:MAG: hypothetical protein BGO39_15335 [Chloroflexi bacterium 54-19]|nr:MAG: hypothetical protein BGO39_15335 [Chloroflexi bacterium 54-19]